MTLYVNGCSHTAAAEAVVPCCFAEDDGDLPDHLLLGRRPHPANLAVSWATHVARGLGRSLVCEAESASSNDRIIRTTQDWIRKNHGQPVLMIIQWSTWEREEWLHDGVWYQVNASGMDMVPQELQDRYREYVLSVDWYQKTQQAHDRIWQLHLELEDLGCPHVFFNGNNHFGSIPQDQRRPWGISHMGAYDAASTWDHWLRSQGHAPVTARSWHFGPEAHRSWAQHVLQYVNTNNLG